MLSKSPVSSKDSKRSKDSKDKKSSKDQDENEKNKDEAEDFTIFKCNKSAFLEDMVNSNEEYVLKKYINITSLSLQNYNMIFNIFRFEDIWKFKDDPDNLHERYYKDMIEREKMAKLEQEIRNIVDELMRSELELLQAAYDKDKAIKGKKSKKPQKKARLPIIYIVLYLDSFLK